MTRKLPDTVASVVDAYPAAAQKQFHAIRTLIHQEADRLEAGPLTETLKWGEPSFLTEASKAGTTIRLAWKSKSANQLAGLGWKPNAIITASASNTCSEPSTST